MLTTNKQAPELEEGITTVHDVLPAVARDCLSGASTAQQPQRAGRQPADVRRSASAQLERDLFVAGFTALQAHRLNDGAAELAGQALRLEPQEIWELFCRGASSVGARVRRWVQIAVEGTFRGHPSGTFAFNKRVFDEIVANNQKATETVVDYEHASTLVGAEAPAAGWVKDLAVRSVDDRWGLWALIEWTARAVELILAGEKRYISPTIIWRSKDRISGKDRGAHLHSIALTNIPFLQELPEVRLRREADDGTAVNDNKEREMDELKKIALKLGLEGEVTAEAVLAAVDQLIDREKNAASAMAEVRKALAMKEDVRAGEMVGAIMRLQNPADRVSVQEFSALKSQLAERDAREAVELAQRDGKVTAGPSKEAPDGTPQWQWAMRYAQQDLAGFREWLASAPAVVPLQQQVQREQKVGDATKLSEQEKLYAAQVGITEDDAKELANLI